MKVKLICEQCGKEYEKDTRMLHAVNRFCGMECYHRSRIGVARPDLLRRYTKVCPVCGKEFETGGRAGDKNKLTCSDACAERSRYRHGSRANAINEIDAAYMAGFIDGEGSIILTERKEKASLRLVIANTNRPVLDWIADKTGVGAITLGKVAGLHNKAFYHWTTNSEAAESVILQLFPYLKIKRPQAELAIETQERLRNPTLNADREWQKEYIIKMKTLNARANSKYYEVTA